MDLWQAILIFLGRLGISALFLWAGMAKILDWKGTVAYMKTRQFPLIPLMLPAAILLQLLGGLSLLFGFYSRIGALLLIIFTIPAMITMHNFWAVKEEERLVEKTLFMKDVAIVGGLLLFLVLGPGLFAFTR